MAKASKRQAEKERFVEKPVSITVVPQGPGSQDIHVEVKRNLSAKKRRSNKRLAALLFTVMFVMICSRAKDIVVYYRLSQDYQELKQYNQELRTIKQRLEEEKESLNSPEMIERLAREDLDMVLPGESKVYQAIPTDDLPRKETLKSGEAQH